MIQFSIFSVFHCSWKVVLAQTFLKIGFGVGKKLKEGDGFDMEGFPESGGQSWRLWECIFRFC
jgi:hypothetical protein